MNKEDKATGTSAMLAEKELTRKIEVLLWKTIPTEHIEYVVMRSSKASTRRSATAHAAEEVLSPEEETELEIYLEQAIQHAAVSNEIADQISSRLERVSRSLREASAEIRSI